MVFPFYIKQFASAHPKLPLLAPDPALDSRQQHGWTYCWSLEEEMAAHSSILAWRISMGRGAWRAIAHGITMSWTPLKRLSMHGDYHTKWSESGRDRQISCDITYLWNQKGDINQHICSFLYKTLISFSIYLKTSFVAIFLAVSVRKTVWFYI